MPQGLGNLDHVVLWNSLRDAHDQRDLALDSVHNGTRSQRRRHIDYGCIGLDGAFGLKDGQHTQAVKSIP